MRRRTWISAGGGRLAVKTLHPAIAGDARALARFKREVHLARQVTHPNVCRLFELFYHHRELRRRAGDRDDLAFLTMELLRGETLAAPAIGPRAVFRSSEAVRAWRSGRGEIIRSMVNPP
jgi:serine/threonine protein kinase